MTRLHYHRGVLEELYSLLPKAVRDEMAIPSYLHRNPLISWLIARRMRVVIAALDLRGKQSVLDFGCGIGMLLMQLPPHQGTYYGVDLLTWPARKVLEAHGRTDVVLLDAADWLDHIADHSLDRIVALEVLEHVDDLSSLVTLFRQKLRPDGRLVVVGPTENLLYQIGRKVAGFSGEYHHRDIYQIMDDIEAVGFVREMQRGILLSGPLALFVACRYRLELQGGRSHEISLSVEKRSR